MTKLPDLTPADIIRIIEARGFALDRTKGSHRIYYQRETHRRVVVPFHSHDLPDGTTREILREAGIPHSDFAYLMS